VATAAPEPVATAVAPAFVAHADEMVLGSEWAVRDRQWRLAQAHELLMRFEESQGRDAANLDELEDWALLAPVEHPIRPCEAALEKAKGIDHLDLASQVAESVEVDRID
jgi:hypothetical protein